MITQALADCTGCGSKPLPPAYFDLYAADLYVMGALLAVILGLVIWRIRDDRRRARAKP